MTNPPATGPFRPTDLEPYLRALHGRPVDHLRATPIGLSGDADKGYGYGMPLRIDYEIDGKAQRAVIETVRPGGFGHEHMSDRAQQLLWAHDAFGRLPRHVESLDVGAVRHGGALVSLGDAQEFFIVTRFVDGAEYAADMVRLRASGELGEFDVARADALCDYLVGIHAQPGPDPALYVRRVRELLGHGECIFGIVDSYPLDHPIITQPMLREIERRCLEWRWKLKLRTHRLRQVHGDFHPWNILFREGADFSSLDRSRGEWGEPADDLSCLTLNYLFFSLQRSGRLEGAFEQLFRRFWDRYLERSGDREVLEVVAPFFAYRALVLASPLWYPNLASGLRRRIHDFMTAVLSCERFDPALVNAYCGV